MTNNRSIRYISVWMALLFTALSVVRAGETLPTLKVGDVTYTNVTVTMVTATDIYFTSDKGMANAKLDTLDPAMQSYFNYDPAKADAAEQAQRAGASQYLLQLTSIPSPVATNRPSGTNRVSMKAAKAAAPAPDERTAAEIQADIAATEDQVRGIVNQPVDPVAPPSGSHVGLFPHWFGGEAEKPDYDTVDVSTTQEFPYTVFDYVSLGTDRSVAFPTSELESNAMIRYYYTDLSVPKKRLTGDEMKEINRLYRIIGKDQQALDALNGR